MLTDGDKYKYGDAILTLKINNYGGYKTYGFDSDRVIPAWKEGTNPGNQKILGASEATALLQIGIMGAVKLSSSANGSSRKRRSNRKTRRNRRYSRRN